MSVESHSGITPTDPSFFKKTKKQSVIHAKSTNKEESDVFRSALAKESLLDRLPYARTVQELFMHSVKAFPNNPCLGTRFPINNNTQWSDYQWRTYAEVNQDRLDFGAGLMHLHHQHVGDKSKNWFLGVFAQNRYEWVVADLGAGAYSIATVALYDTLGPETSEFILNHAECPIIVTSIDKVAGLLELSSQCPLLKVIIVMESLNNTSTDLSNVLKRWAHQVGVVVVSFADVIGYGRKYPCQVRLPTAKDIWCLSYTSGTTGNPKGAILTQTNIISAIAGGSTNIMSNHDDVHISYLPLAHIFERINMLVVLLGGGRIGFFRGDILLLMEDIAVLKPTLFIGVPRLLNRLYEKIMQTVQSGSALKAALFNKALESKLHYLKTDHLYTHQLWDSLIFSKVKQVLGGRVRLIVSGSAPISSDVLNFFRVLIGGPVIEGYGQTETSAGTTIAWPDDLDPGHVGPPNVSTELKLVSVPDMNYHAKNLTGEIWVRGPSVFQGYYKDEEKTKETITPDGWLKTGDIAKMDACGRIHIIDRKKNIFKLSQGEYVAPEKLEIIYSKSSFVAQIYVHGDSLQNELVAIVVPDQEYSIPYAIQNGLLPSNTSIPTPTLPNQPLNPIFVTLCQSEQFKKCILQDIQKVGSVHKVQGFEMIKSIAIEPSFFTIESGLLTPTMKLKRPEAVKKYRVVIDQMYADLSKSKSIAKL